MCPLNHPINLMLNHKGHTFIRYNIEVFLWYKMTKGQKKPSFAVNAFYALLLICITGQAAKPLNYSSYYFAQSNTMKHQGSHNLRVKQYLDRFSSVPI